jgi:hypothetical protein
MPSIQTDPLFCVADTGIFLCAECDRPMRLCCVEPQQPGFDLRTYECTQCRNTVKLVASI